MVPNIDGTIGHTIKTRKHPRHGTQCVIQYPTMKPFPLLTEFADIALRPGHSQYIINYFLAVPQKAASNIP